MVLTTNNVNNAVRMRKAIAYIKHLTAAVGEAKHTEDAESRILITKLSCILNSKAKLSLQQTVEAHRVVSR
jgi:hypothetical protein